ncbi:MAG: hypothetical protein ABIR66_11060 [Saprospiraceae bacterium]
MSQTVKVTYVYSPRGAGLDMVPDEASTGVISAQDRSAFLTLYTISPD